MRTVALIASPGLWQLGHGDTHPLRPERLRRTFELLEAYGALAAPNVRVVEPTHATDDQLALFHTRDYIEAVRKLSSGDRSISQSRYNFGPGDNPVFEGMFESESLKAGGALLAAGMLVRRECDTAFHYAGGLHHAAPDHASGFCVFNDAAIAIRWLIRQGLRVAYVDVDVHHGDGVQWGFYDSGRVLTVSLHQSGNTLFPGTGSVDECGRSAGEGNCVNVPLPPHTEDEEYLWALGEIVPPIVRRFEPDILVTQLGVDTHYLDPLAELKLTTRGHKAIFAALESLGLRWLALGGGGYNLEVVPRAWALAFAVMAGLSLPDELPESYRAAYGGRWLEDRESPEIDPVLKRLVRRRVEEVVSQVKQVHGLQ
jgi:acetoin utilization protein AcuC